ncbi:exportin-T-like [Phragmites australis]|uniref:exportin-T-like n=1 Tax=Phragmites australis TaxID=29695 RepID=UPI002D793614|nr:exportin-T-like [Phragmites australis]XP_062187228.1 exportin-T-like [Phragmites australis]XP_062187229.1 exportin-T-like [Phragmites australis]XP_062187230.1 exportin-T-like [Phragmites australis]
MDDLEQAILLASDSPAAAAACPAVRAEALAFCARARDESPPSSLLRLCLSGLTSSPHAQVHFWCLQSLHYALVRRRLALPDDLALLRSSLLSLAVSSHSASPPFLRNKLAQLVALLVRLDYPHVYPSYFLDLLPPPPPQPGPTDMFARVLISLDDDLLSQDYPRSADEASDAMRVKDSMRAQCVPQIARHWHAAASTLRTADPAAAAVALDAARRCISWIDVGLVANDVFVPLLFDIAMSPGSAGPLAAAAVGCLSAVAAKGMDSRAKVALLRSLLVAQQGLGSPDSGLKMAPLVTTYAAEALECYRRLGPSDADGAAALEMLEEVLTAVFAAAESCDEEEVDSGSVLEFLSGYVSMMKAPSEKQLGHLGRILEVVRVQMSYDPAYRGHLDALDKIGKEEEDLMAEQRKDLVALFRSICRVAPAAAQLFIRGLLVTSLSSAEASVEDVEVALTLFFWLGEVVGEEEIRTGTGLLGELVPMLLSARFSCHTHRLVALVYLETVTRYMKFTQEHVQYVPHLLGVFLDNRGIHHQNAHVSRRAGYLFMRAVKLLKAKLVPYLDTILQSLQDVLGQFTSMGWTNKDPKLPSSEDGSQIFEAVGLLIGIEDISPEKQAQCLTAFLNPLCHQIESLVMDAKAQGHEESLRRAMNLQQIIVALNMVSKGFNERLVMGSRPAIGVMFKKTLDVVLQVLVSFPNVRTLRSKVISFLHRMIEILGISVLPCIPLRQLLLDNEAKDMVDFLILVNQIICKFNSSASGILEDVFPTIASRLSVILSQDAFSAGPASNTEEIRELQELQRTLYTFLHAMAAHDLSTILLAPSSRQYLETIMQLLLFTSCSHKDILLRKACVQIFVKLIKDWCTNSEDKLPGFRVFMIEKFATGCCLYSVLDKSFDLRDANTLVLFGEIVMAQKIMYERFGEDFIVNFVTKGLPEAHCPPDLAEQYFQKLQGNDIKAFRTFYQSLIEKIRQQENGSLVFR